MNAASLLHPTLWRTSRVLANRTRLRMLALLLRQPDLTVSAVADGLGIAPPDASRNLRALEARGFLAAKRDGRRVKYRWNSQAETPVQLLLAALHHRFDSASEPVEEIFKTATAFTHPRRMEILRVLNEGPRNFEQLQSTTRVSTPALRRHLRKLRTRTFVSFRSGRFRVEPRADLLGRELMRLATAG